MMLVFLLCVQKVLSKKCFFGVIEEGKGVIFLLSYSFFSYCFLTHFLISLFLQWRKSSPTEWCSDKAWDLLYSMWNLSYPWEAENHHIQESLQESVSITCCKSRFNMVSTGTGVGLYMFLSSLWESRLPVKVNLL